MVSLRICGQTRSFYVQYTALSVACTGVALAGGDTVACLMKVSPGLGGSAVSLTPLKAERVLGSCRFCRTACLRLSLGSSIYYLWDIGRLCIISFWASSSVKQDDDNVSCIFFDHSYCVCCGQLRFLFVQRLPLPPGHPRSSLTSCFCR